MLKSWAASQESINGASAGRIDFYVANEGSDANPGTLAAPFATITAAIAASSAGQTIGLKGGQEHLTGTQNTALTVNRQLRPYGAGKATLDARQHLTGATWTQRAGTTNCWEATIVGRETTQNNGVLSNSWTYHLWFPGNVHGVWKVGGADIATNVTQVDANPGSYTVYRSGSTVQDPRSDTNATTYVWVVHMPDGSDPNTKDLSISDRGLAWSFGVGLIRDIIVRGAARKDFEASAYSYPFPTLDDTERYDCNEHGHVGPVTVTDTYKAVGKAIPGVTVGTNYNRANGGGLNIFSSVNLTAYDIALSALDVTNFTNGLYGHGSGNLLYRTLTVSNITGSNLGTIVKIDPFTGTLVELIIDGVTITAVNVSEVGNGFSGFSGSVNGGTVNFSTNPLDTNPTLVNFTTTAPDLTLSGVEWNFPTARSVSWQNNIYGRSTDGTHTAPILRLHGCADISPWANKGHARRAGGVTSSVTLYLTGNTEIGSIMDQAAGVNYPTGLYVEAGCTFGMGDRTGPQIEAALSGAGVPFDISGQTTIVNRAGTILSAPGWK